MIRSAYTASFSSLATRKATFLLAFGRRVPSHPGGALPHLEDADAAQADFVALLEVPGRQRHQIAEHGLAPTT